MKCQIQFSGKNKKNIINLSSAENAQRVVKVKVSGCWTFQQLYRLKLMLPIVYFFQQVHKLF